MNRERERHAPPAPNAPAGVVAVVAEDNPSILELMAHVLAVVPAKVIPVRDGAAAWEAIRAHHPPIAVLDADMPLLDGLEVAALVRGDPSLAETRVLLVTGHANIAAAAAAAGVHRVLDKPFRPRDLIDAVRELAGAPR